MEYKVNVKNVYYLDNNKKVCNYYVGQDVRLSKAKAKVILDASKVDYKVILRVISESIKVTIPHDIIKDGVVK